MSAVTLSANSSPDTSTAQHAMHISGKVAGEAINAGQPVYMGTDGKIYKYVATKIFAGIAARKVEVGQPVTVYGTHTRFHVSDAGSLVMGNLYYVNTAGAIDTAATASDTIGAFYAVSAKDLLIIRVGNLLDAT